MRAGPPPPSRMFPTCAVNDTEAADTRLQWGSIEVQTATRDRHRDANAPGLYAYANRKHPICAVRDDGAPTSARSVRCCAAFTVQPPLGAPSAAFMRRRAALRIGCLARDEKSPARPSASASSWQGSLVTPGGAPVPPECELAKLARRRCIPLRSNDASRERPSLNGTNKV
jgi:hypothetical protein